MCEFRLDQQSRFVSASGVYFMQMLVERKFTEPPPDVRTFDLDSNKVKHSHSPYPEANKGFGRQ